MNPLRDYFPVQKRLLVPQFAVLLAVLCVEGRLAYLQLFKYLDYRQLATRQQYIPKEVPPSRGVIKDRNGALLAMNIDLCDVYAYPDQVRDKSRAAAVLAKALGASYADVSSRLASDKSFVWLARQVPFERSEAVAGLRLEGVGAYREQHRFYPDHDMAAHVVGFAGMDNQGLGGLEHFYDAVLKGKKGSMMAKRDARGRLVIADAKSVKASVDGAGLATTLDKTIQHIAQVELEKAFQKYRCQKASIIVMDPKTGEILALANYPTFDPNHYASYSKEDWKDRAVNDEFEPGSTFKLVAAAAALEEGVVSEEDRFFCENGAYKTDYGRVVTDHEKHGWLTFREVFGYSSNIGMVKVGAKLGKEKLYRFAQRFGFGTPTGVDLPGETPGKLRPPDKWSGLSMTSIPYGYEISASPLQVLQAYAAIANGGVMVKPYLVQRLEAADGTPLKEFGPREVRRVCSARTARRMTELMKWVVEKGTATAVALPNYAIAGKTGTAYKFMKGHYSRNNYVSSFVGFVPAEDPKFVIYVSLDDPRGLYWGGYTAGPVFKEVAKRAMAYERIPTSADPVEPREAGTGRTVPSFTGLTPVQCRWLAERAQLKLKFQGKGERVVLQSEKAGFVQAVPGRGAAVFLTLGEPEAVKAQGLMPDLQGKTKRQALALLAPLGMKVNFRGEGVVRFQFPPAGRKVGESGLCELNCDTPLTRSAQGTPGGKS